MSFKLEKNILQNIVDATKYEWVEGGGSGCYAASTCVGMNTRREHGLYVVPDTSYNDKIVVLSKFEESVFIENRLHEISTNQYTSGIFPQGFTYLQKFEMNPFPRFTYLVEDRIIEKTIFIHEENAVVVARFELKNQGEPIDLVIKPFIADRLNKELATETQGLNTDSYRGQHFVRWAPKANMPELYVYFDKGEYISATLWYHNFYYPKDFGRFQGQNEDLFNPGFFQIQLRPYESLNLYISTENLDTFELDYEAIYRKEVEHRSATKRHFSSHKHLSLFENVIQKSAFKIKNIPVITASNIEHNFNTRDTLFSIPGTIFLPKKFDMFKELFQYLISKLDNGLLPTKTVWGTNGISYGAADLPLWLIHFSYQYYQLTDDLDFFDDKIFDALISIYDSFNKGTLFNIFVEKNKLVSCGDPKTSVSWIPLKDKDGSVLRYGNLLEINALWYNALCILEDLSLKLKKRRLQSRLKNDLEKCQKAFVEMFMTDSGTSFHDFVNKGSTDSTFRVNQVIPLMLAFSPIDQSVARKVLDEVKNRLLTPYGLRSKEIPQDYTQPHTPVYLHRFMADYYNGAIWPWTTYLYVEAFSKNIQNARPEARELYAYFEPLLNLTQEGLIGYIPEAVAMDIETSQSGMADYFPASSGILWSFFKLILKMRS